MTSADFRDSLPRSCSTDILPALDHETKKWERRDFRISMPFPLKDFIFEIPTFSCSTLCISRPRLKKPTLAVSGVVLARQI